MHQTYTTLAIDRRQGDLTNALRLVEVKYKNKKRRVRKGERLKRKNLYQGGERRISGSDDHPLTFEGRIS